MRLRLGVELPGLRPFAPALVCDLVLSLSARLILHLDVVPSRQRMLLVLHNVVSGAAVVTAAAAAAIVRWKWILSLSDTVQMKCPRSHSQTKNALGLVAPSEG